MKKVNYKSLVVGALLACTAQLVLADTIGPIERTQDTWVNGTSAGVDRNYGGTNSLRIDNGEKMKAYIQFDVTGIPAGHVVDSAILTLVAFPTNPNPIVETSIYPVTGTWDELVLTWNNDTLVWGDTALASAQNIAPGASVDFDVTSGVTADGSYTFGVQMLDTTYTNIKYGTKSAATMPTLTIITSLAAPADTTAPVFDANIPAVEVNATGTLTDISAGVNAANITATDETDPDPIAATINGDTNLPSGSHTVTLQATDAAGNSATTDITVNITPLLTLSADQSALAGTTAQVSVGLSGPAAAYPVTLDYSIAGDAVTDSTGSLTFNDANAQTVDVAVLAGALAGQTGVLTLSGAVNAQLPLIDNTTITALQGNSAPTISLLIEQNGSTLYTVTADNAGVIHYIDGTAGLVTLTATITDVNQADTHSVSWQGSSDLLTGQGTTLDISPDLLSGNVDLTVSATEENTADSYTTTLTTTIKVIATSLPVLASDVDSDGDGVFDSDEGYKDSDGDGIVDYLDTNSDNTELPLLAGDQPLKTEAGLSLSLGNISVSANGIAADSAVISLDDLVNNVAPGSADTSDTGYVTIAGVSLINFIVSGLTDGGTASVVYPLPDGVTITDNAEYRKYTATDGWMQFVSDSDNAIASAAKDGTGVCPDPNTDAYNAGLTAGANCIQLTILDGGIYDADGLANGSIEDPGVLAEANVAPQWSADPIQLATTSVNENTSATITADLTTYASDGDGDALTYAKVDGPAWLTVDANGGLSADLAGVATGDYTATVSVTDTKGQTVETIVNLSVVLNEAPVFTAAALAAASPYQDYSASIADQITDPEGDSYTITKTSGPNWLTVSETGELSGQPINADIGVNSVSIEIVDSNGAISTPTFEITVEGPKVKAKAAGSFPALLIALLGLVSLVRRRQL